MSPVTQMDERADGCDEYPTSNDEQHGSLHPQDAFREKWIVVLDLQKKTSLVDGDIRKSCLPKQCGFSRAK